MKHLIPLFLFFIFHQFVLGQDPLLTNVINRKTISLDGKWHYIIDPTDNGYYDYRRIPFDSDGKTPGTSAYFTNSYPTSKGERIEYNFEKSPTLLVPGDWNTQVKELLWYEGTVWYQRNFMYQKPKGKEVFLYFGAANYETIVWVNGKKAGSHIGGFTPFNFKISDLLEEGENFIVVKVNNTRKKEAVPTEATDWWNYGGITRSIKLIELPETFIRDFKVQLSKGSTEELTGYVQLSGKEIATDVTIRIPEAKIEQVLKTDNSGKVDFTINAKKLERWSLEKPKLYNVELQTGEDLLTDRIGFRTIEAKGQDILLNGEKIFLKGICMHEENPFRGRRNFSKADAKLMLDWIKELNANFIRLAHYPHNEYMPRLADELGILLWEEVPVYWTIDWGNEGTLKNARNQLTELITRDKNRASVIIWSMANETPVSVARNEFLKNMATTARSLDDTRLVSAAMEVHTDGLTKTLDDPFGEYTDIISFNQYHGWYGGDRDQFSNIKWEIKYNKPVVVSEWGGGAQYGFHADKETVWSEEYQAYLYEKTLEGLSNIPGFSGTTPWILADFRSPRRPLPIVQDMWNRKGIIAEGGHKKQAFYILQKYYKNK
ncbi:MAG: glycoside hydrolase family 2 TIM barrel-domain containing protein [Bacteroidota bacterium]